MTPIDKVRAALEYASRFVPALDSSGINEALRELDGKAIVTYKPHSTNIVISHYDEYSSQMKVGGITYTFIREQLPHFRRALEILSEIETGKYVLCEKRTHTPEHDGATGYDYYAPVKLEDV